MSENNICRFCMQQDETVVNELTTVADIVHEIFQIELDLNPALPSMVCNLCRERLDASKLMRNLCLQSVAFYENAQILIPESSGSLSFYELIVKDDEDDENYQMTDETEVENDADEIYVQVVDDVTEVTPLAGKCCACHESFKDVHRHFSHAHPELLHESDGSSTKFSCPICQKTFKYQKMLREHHTTTHDCTVCEERFLTAAKLFMHMDKEHSTTESVYECGKCGKTYNRWSSLRYHDHQMHNEKNKFECHECGKVFRRRNLFQEHRNIHLNLRPYECDLCGASFTSNGGLRSHGRSHTGQKPFVCKECGKAYSHYSDMKRHSYTHTGDFPFTCEVCGKNFAQSRKYINHMALHNILIEVQPNSE